MQTGTIPMNEAAGAPKALFWPLAVLMVLATVNGFNALSDLTTVLIGLLAGKAQGGAGWLDNANTVIRVVLVIVTLVLALGGDLRRAIMAFALVGITGFLLESVPAIVRHAADTKEWGAFGIAMLSIWPLIAVAAILLARRGDRPWLATIVVVLPTAIGLVIVGAFTLGQSLSFF